jgi:ubiquinone/menaquinone biosynthesis C-methylase UbiE
MSDTRGWESLSDWYDKKQGDGGDLWHRSLIDPILIKLIGSTTNKSTLDLGCGNGYLSRRFAKQGAIVTAIDSSASMIERAKAHDPKNDLAIKYEVAEAHQLDLLNDESFDIVYANMTLMDMEKAEDAIREVARVLKKRGRFVASLAHPCFDNGKNSSWILEKSYLSSTIYRKITGYRQLFSEEFPWRVSESETIWTRGYHRPLSWYSRILSKSGLAIIALEEPEPTPEFLEKEEQASGFLEVPLHLVIEALKL